MFPYTYIGTGKSNVSDVISQETSSDTKLLEYTALKDEKTGPTSSVEPSISDTAEDKENPFYMRAQSIPLGTHNLEQEHEERKELLKHDERFKSLDLDVAKPVKSPLHHWDDMTNLAELKDEDKSANDESSSSNVAGFVKNPKNTVPYRDSVVSASSIESFMLDEHGNLNCQYSDFDKMKTDHGASSSRSSCVDIDDIVITTTEIFPIPEGQYMYIRMYMY